MAMSITMATKLLPNITIHRTSGKLRLPPSGDFQRREHYKLGVAHGIEGLERME